MIGIHLLMKSILNFHTAKYRTDKMKYKFKRPRWKKTRGWKKKHRAEIKISDITADGFRLRTFNREYYVSRKDYPWFMNATQQEIQDVELYPCPLEDPTTSSSCGDHLCWWSLDVDICTNTFEYPERFTAPSKGIR